MSEVTGLSLRGIQVNPKPRPRDPYGRSTPKIGKNISRPSSAIEGHKSLKTKHWENTSRPKSASDIPLHGKRNLNRQADTIGHCKAIVTSKSSKCSEMNPLRASEIHIKRSCQTPSGRENEDHFCNLEGRENKSPRCGGSNYLIRPLRGNVIQNVPDDFDFNAINFKRELSHEGVPFDSLLEHFQCEVGEIECTSPNKAKEVSEMPTCLGYEKNMDTNHVHKSEGMTKDLEMSLIDDEKLEMDSLKCEYIPPSSVQECSKETAEIDTTENNLISILVDIENDMVPSCNNNSLGGLKFSGEGKYPISPANHFPCLIEDDFPTTNTEIENEIKMFQVLCDVSPRKENKNGDAECEEIVLKSSPSGMSCDSLEKNFEDANAEIVSQIAEVDNILKTSREHLHEDIIDVLNIHERSSELTICCNVNEATKIITERPPCTEGSSECWIITTESRVSQDRQTNSPNYDTSSIDDFHGDIFDSDPSPTSYGIKSSCKTSDVPAYTSASPHGNATHDDYHKEKEKLYMQPSVESVGNCKSGQSSDEDPTYDGILSTLKVLEREEREPVLLSSRPPPTGSEFDHTPRVKLKELIAFLDDVDQSCSFSLSSGVDGLPTTDSESFDIVSVKGNKCHKKSELSSTDDLVSCCQIQEMRLQEQAKGLALLKQELEKTREKSTREKDKMRKKLEEEHAKIVMRHQEFIEKLLAEKKVVNEKCEALILKLQRSEESYKATLHAMEEHHAIELRNEHERARLELRASRDKWIREKTQKIQTATAKGAEGEVKRLVSEQAYQIEALWKARLDELRGRLEREAEEGMAKERELARKRLEERVEEMDRFHQEERRKFLAEECMLRSRAEEAERRVRDTEEEARKRCAENLNAERARAQANIEKVTDEFEKNLQIALSKERAQREKAAEAARKEERELMEIEQKKRESKLKEQFRLERDRGIEKAVLQLTRQAEKTQQELEARTEMTLRRMRERCDEQVQIAEAEAEKERKQCAEIRSQSAALLEENSSLKTAVSRLEKELEAAHKLTACLQEERSQIRELVVEEWSARVAALREEVGILKAQVIGERERREMELAQVQKEREHELIQVQKRVEIAIAKKEQSANQLKSKYEAALRKCSHLEELLDKQRKDLLLK